MRCVVLWAMTDTREYAPTRAAPAVIPKGVETLSVAALDAMSFGIAVIDDTGLVYANQAMMRIAAENDGLLLSPGGLILANQEEHAHYLKIIARALQAESRDQIHDTVVISASRPSGKKPYGIFINQSLHAPDLVGSGSASTVVWVSNPGQNSFLNTNVLVNLFDLTAAESRLAIGLIEHGSLQRASAASGLTEGSARQYMKRIFAKTQVRGQVELVALILSSIRL